MIVNVFITKFKSRQYEAKGGIRRTAHDLEVMDSEPNPLRRLSTAMLIQLDEDEWGTIGQKPEGRQIDLVLKQFLEMRNGLPKFAATLAPDGLGNGGKPPQAGK